MIRACKCKLSSEKDKNVSLEKDKNIRVIRVRLAHPGSILLTNTLLFTLLQFIISLILQLIFCFISYFTFHHVISYKKDGFTEVTRGRKKPKASNSPTLTSQFKPGSSEPPLGTPVRSKPSFKNTIPVILSGVDEKLKNWRKLICALRQFHPASKFHRSRNYQKARFCSYRRLSARHHYTTERE